MASTFSQERSRKFSGSSKVTSQNAFQDTVTLPKFVHLMSELGIEGPRQTRLNVESFCYEEIGQGGQFQVFRYTVSDLVAKRVNLHVMVDRNSEQLRDLELEIRALASELIQDHPNIVDLIGWGYDTVYESSTSSQIRSDMRFPLRVPVLYVEPAIASLDKFLTQSTSWNARLQMCLDIAGALECLRECEILHNDLKPQNVLVFRQDDETESYVAKLADFGLAITPDEKNSRWFSDYGKTTDWKPPESIDYSEKKHGTCSNKMMFKSESYAYGMLALYTLFSPNTEHTPLPFNRNKRIRETQITALLCGAEEAQQNDAMEVWDVIEDRFLKERPEARAEVFPSQLFGVSAYQKWDVSFNKALKLRAKRAGPGRKPPRFNKGWWFYRSLQPQLLDLLMEGESTAFDDYPADLLFGMAIKKAFNKGEGFHEDVRRLTYAATMANPPSIRAMGIFERINRAIVPVNLNIKASDAREMLYDAAASGSLTALSDLHKLNPDMASLAVQHFRSSGGYNRESLLAFKVPPLIIVEKMTLAAFSEDSSALEELGLDIRTRKGALGYFDDYNTLLHLAATFGACNVIRYLVEIRKMEVDTQNAYGETPLYKSCVAGQYESAMLLLDLGANPSIRAGEMQVTCLHWLLVFDPAHMECIAGRLISNYLRVDETVNPILLFKGYEQYPFETMNHFPFHWPIGTPLHWAAHMGNVDAVITLFKHGSSVDVLDAPNDAQSQTPLSMAMYRADSVIVKLLLDNGANPSRADGKGRTPLHMLAGDFWMQNRLFPISKSLLQWCSHGDFESSLRETGACINAIIEAGALLNSERHDSALTPLMDAVNNENVVAANALLDAGADANSYRDWSGRLPLHVWATIQPDRLAYPEGYFPTLEKFLNCTRETSLPHKTITSLVLETMSPQSIDDTFWRQKLDMMLSHRYHQININARNDDGTNILLTLMNIQKSDMNYWDAVQWLRRKGADIAARDNRDRDFLWYTSENREVGDLVCLKLTRLYLECVMNKSKEQVLNDSKDSDSGMTALMSLCGNGYVESVRHMLEVGVEVNDSDKNGRTALDYSLDTGNRFRLGLWTNFLNYLGRMPNASDNPTDDLFQRSGIGKDLHEGQGSHAKVKSTKDKYFAFPQITAALIDAHGKTGKQLGRRLNAPDIKSSEKEILDFANVENFQVENQPFYELWEQAYQFDDDTKEEIDQLSFNKKGWSVPPAIRDMIREREEREEREERSKTS